MNYLLKKYVLNIANVLMGPVPSLWGLLRFVSAPYLKIKRRFFVLPSFLFFLLWMSLRGRIAILLSYKVFHVVGAQIGNFI